jgi:hypothetical protein
MKFLEKINRNYLIPFSLVLIVVTFAGYFLLRNIIISQAKERLISKEYLVEEQIKKGENYQICLRSLKFKNRTGNLRLIR